MSNKNICVLEPTEGAGEDARLPASTIRFYRSSLPGFVSVTMHQPGYGLTAGTRLTLDQIIELHDDLTTFLDQESVLKSTDAYDFGYSVGDADGYAAGVAEATAAML